MRKIILCVAVSLDGLIEGPNGEYDWCMTDQDYGLNDLLARVDAVFMGRKSYEMVQGMNIDASGMPTMKEYIFSNTLTSVKEGATLVSGDLRKAVEEIKQQPGKDIWLWGGAGLTTSLINLQLVDELQLAVHPLILGSGKPLFNNITGRIPLELVSSKAYPTGLVFQVYTLKR